jgi:hypothetical protein
MNNGFIDLIFEDKNKSKLFLGNIIGAKNLTLLSQLKIKCVLTCASEAYLNYENIIHKKIELFDLETENIT